MGCNDIAPLTVLKYVAILYYYIFSIPFLAHYYEVDPLCVCRTTHCIKIKSSMPSYFSLVGGRCQIAWGSLCQKDLHMYLCM